MRFCTTWGSGELFLPSATMAATTQRLSSGFTLTNKAKVKRYQGYMLYSVIVSIV